MAMRSARQVSLVPLHEIDFRGAVQQSALALGDVDGDGAVELIVGTCDGELFVFKYGEQLALAENLGTLICILVGDFLGRGQSDIVALSGEGDCFVFTLQDEIDAAGTDSDTISSGPHSPQGSPPRSPHLSCRSASSIQTSVLTLLGRFDVPWNITCAILIDPDESGTPDLLLAERQADTARVARFHYDPSQPDTLELVRDWYVGSAVSLSYAPVGSRQLVLVGQQVGGVSSIDLDGQCFKHTLSDEVALRNRATELPSRMSSPGPYQVPFEFHPIGVENNDAPTLLMPSFVLGNIIPALQASFDETGSEIVPPEPSSSAGSGRSDSLAQSPNAAADAKGDASQLDRGGGDGSAGTGEDGDDSAVEVSHVEYLALAIIWYGETMRAEHLVLESRQPKQLFNEQFMQEDNQDRHIFTIQAVDVTKDGTNDIVSCTWDGLTCIHDLAFNVVRYQFDSRVQGFLAGTYSPRQGQPPTTCFVYFKVGGGITVFENVSASIPFIPVSNLIDVLSDLRDPGPFCNRLTQMCNPEFTRAVLSKLKTRNSAESAELTWDEGVRLLIRVLRTSVYDPQALM